MSQFPVFDHAHLKRFTDGDAALEAELAGLLFTQADRCIGIMKSARDADDWSAAVHTLKGAARGVGAIALSEACEQVETAAPAEWSKAAQSVERVSEDTKRVIKDTLKL